MEPLISSLIIRLAKRNMQGFYISSRDELIPLLQKLIPGGSTVGCGDSVTLEQTGVLSFLREMY